MSRIPDHHPEMGDASFGGIALDALGVARSAQSKAEQALRDIEGHEDICAERYQNINDKLGMLFKIIAWAGGAGFVIIMGLLGYLSKTTFEGMNTLQRVTLERVQQAPHVIVQREPGETVEH